MAHDEVIALLIRARGFIERGWCKGEFALNKDGQRVSSKSSDAVQWCALGALSAASGLSVDDLWEGPAHHRLRTVIGGETVVSFNDRQKTVKPLLKVFDRAIAMRDAVAMQSVNGTPKHE